ncbi:MAG TPA: hypothetical protein PL143_10300, partial [Rhodocyclaceae bacterium]|nr:hypothetical protein [Rhodocyclaceae bacterium]
MDEQQPISPRRRMQILQAIPDSERTDEEWDELNELEIMFAPGNRVGAGGEPFDDHAILAQHRDGPRPHPADAA